MHKRTRVSLYIYVAAISAYFIPVFLGCEPNAHEKPIICQSIPDGSLEFIGVVSFIVFLLMTSFYLLLLLSYSYKQVHKKVSKRS